MRYAEIDTSENYMKVGNNCRIDASAIVGLRYRQECEPAILGDNCIVRRGTVIYADVVIGSDMQTGHNVLIREKIVTGKKIIIGTGSVLEGNITIGDRVKIESLVFIPTHTTIGSDVFIGPGAVLTNDRYPQRLRDTYRPEGPILENGVSLGANVTVLPGLRIGEGSFVAASAVVTKDVPPWSLVRAFGEISPLPEKLMERNRALRW